MTLLYEVVHMLPPNSGVTVEMPDVAPADSELVVLVKPKDCEVEARYMPEQGMISLWRPGFGSGGPPCEVTAQVWTGSSRERETRVTPSYADYPHTCPLCGHPAYVGERDIDCTNCSGKGM